MLFMSSNKPNNEMPSNVSLSDLVPFTEYLKTSALLDTALKKEIVLGNIDAFFFVAEKNDYFRANKASLESQIFSSPQKMDLSFHDPAYAEKDLFKIRNTRYSIDAMFLRCRVWKLRSSAERSDKQYEIEFEQDGKLKKVVVGHAPGVALFYLLKQTKSGTEWNKAGNILQATGSNAIQLRDLFIAKDAKTVWDCVTEGDGNGLYRLR